MTKGPSGADLSVTGKAQQTLKRAICCKGIGLHSGASIHMELLPAKPDSGIRFVRTDLIADAANEPGGDPDSLPEHAVIPARWDHVVDTKLSTTIGNRFGAKVATVEHIMAAFAGCGIDNVLVRIAGAEVPVMDGSAEPFAFLIECAGAQPQSRRRKWLKVLKPVSIDDGDRSAKLMPSDRSLISLEIDFPGTQLREASALYDITSDEFRSQLAAARTFTFEHELNYLRSNGLAQGGSLDNAVVFRRDGDTLNQDGLRYCDEPLRHKALDALGDLYLGGALILGHFHGVRSGHAINNLLLRKLMQDDEAWTFVDDRQAGIRPATPRTGQAAQYA